MKINKIKSVMAIVAVMASSLTSSFAILIPYEIPGPGVDISKNGTGIGGANGNDDADNFFRLQTVLASFANSLPTAIFSGVEDLGSASVTGTGLLGFDYAVLHYGKGPGGTGGGGGVEVWFLNGASSFDFPDTGSGPNGLGGFSTLTLFAGTPGSVPDGGNTAILLSFAIFGLVAVARRYRTARV